MVIILAAVHTESEMRFVIVLENGKQDRTQHGGRMRKQNMK